MRALILLLVTLVAVSSSLRAQTPSAPSVALRPGDVISVEVWREEDLTGEFLVNENGDVTLPLLGEIHVVDVPLAQLRDSLIAAYRRELRNPSIVITPLRRIYVLGEVTEPGLYNVDPTISLAGAIAMAGGANTQGDLDNIRVVRGDGQVRAGLRMDSQLSEADVRSGDQIFVGRRSWFDRNSTFIVSALLSITSIVISLVR